jgi:hypothetical protein
MAALALAAELALHLSVAKGRRGTVELLWRYCIEILYCYYVDGSYAGWAYGSVECMGSFFD